MPLHSRPLPNGQRTTDPDEYVDAWHAIADPFCDTVGGRLIGYGSGITVALGPYESLTLSVDFVERINRLQAERDAAVAALRGCYMGSYGDFG